jgi:light-regulated signal transduction histidine kinase (bacteriophytochrome)
LKYHKQDTPPQVLLDSSFTINNGWSINIKDNGIRLNEKFADRIFIPLERLHGMSAYKGTGIGLAICKKIISRHGESIFVKSQEGQGSTFTLPEIQSPRLLKKTFVILPGSLFSKDHLLKYRAIIFLQFSPRHLGG